MSLYYYDDDKSTTINKIFSIVLAIVMSAIILFCLYIVIKPIVIEDDSYTTKDNVNSADLQRIEEVINRISSQYVDELDKEKLIEGAIKGITSATDDVYTRYMSEEEYQEILTSGTEVYDGIGVHITYDDNSNAVMILGIMPDSPALKANLNIGDMITKIDGIDITKETYNECIDKLKGKEGETVNLTIKKSNGSIEEKNITKSKISTNNVSSEIINDNIGYIKIW